MSNELKPCPFCGGAGKVRKAGPGPHVECEWCGAKGGPACSTEGAVAAWNRRAGAKVVEG